MQVVHTLPRKLLVVSGFYDDVAGTLVAELGFLKIAEHLGTERHALGLVVEIELAYEFQILAFEEIYLVERLELFRCNAEIVCKTASVLFFVVVFHINVRLIFAGESV